MTTTEFRDLTIWIGETIGFAWLMRRNIPIAIDVLTHDRWTKLPLSALIGVLTGSFMAWISYVPTLLCAYLTLSFRDYFKHLQDPDVEAVMGYHPTLWLFKLSHYGYLLVTFFTYLLFEARVGNARLWEYLISLR